MIAQPSLCLDLLPKHWRIGGVVGLRSDAREAAGAASPVDYVFPDHGGPAAPSHTPAPGLSAKAACGLVDDPHGAS